MKTIKELDNSVVGSYIERLHTLGGMRMPEDPKATVDYIKHKYGNFYESLLGGATDFLLEGFYEPRTNTISASMLIKCFKSYLGTPEGKKHYKKVSTYKMPEKSPEELAEIDRKAMKVIAENYYLSFHEGQVKIHFKQMQSIHEYAKQWLDQEYRDDMTAEIEYKLQKYLERSKRTRLRENHDKGALRSLGYQITDDMKDYDLAKLVDVASVIEKRIEEGWKP